MKQVASNVTCFLIFVVRQIHSFKHLVTEHKVPSNKCYQLLTII